MVFCTALIFLFTLCFTSSFSASERKAKHPPKLCRVVSNAELANHALLESLQSLTHLIEKIGRRCVSSALEGGTEIEEWDAFAKAFSSFSSFKPEDVFPQRKAREEISPLLKRQAFTHLKEEISELEHHFEAWSNLVRGENMIAEPRSEEEQQRLLEQANEEIEGAERKTLTALLTKISGVRRLVGKAGFIENAQHFQEDPRRAKKISKELNCISEEIMTLLETRGGLKAHRRQQRIKEALTQAGENAYNAFKYHQRARGEAPYTRMEKATARLEEDFKRAVVSGIQSQSPLQELGARL